MGLPLSLVGSAGDTFGHLIHGALGVLRGGLLLDLCKACQRPIAMHLVEGCSSLSLMSLRLESVILAGIDGGLCGRVGCMAS